MKIRISKVKIFHIMFIVDNVHSYNLWTVTLWSILLDCWLVLMDCWLIPSNLWLSTLTKSKSQTLLNRKWANCCFYTMSNSIIKAFKNEKGSDTVFVLLRVTDFLFEIKSAYAKNIHSLTYPLERKHYSLAWKLILAYWRIFFLFMITFY